MVLLLPISGGALVMSVRIGAIDVNGGQGTRIWWISDGCGLNFSAFCIFEAPEYPSLALPSP